MLTEQDIINIVDPILRGRPCGTKVPLENDAERIDVASNRLLVTTDEFSGEDLFDEGNPRQLGWNLAVAAISDVLAAGGTPKYYTHAMAVKPDWDRKFLSSLAQGIARALMAARTTFAGGDTGLSGQWHYTATVIGEASGRPLTRRGAGPGDVIYLTGPIGAGNLQAALSMYAGKGLAGRVCGAIPAVFPLRPAAAFFLRDYATSCIDTSDGVFNALNQIADINGTGYEIGNPPYIKTGAILAKALSLPATLLLLGECGEYELLFTIPAGIEQSFQKKARAKKMKFHRLGTVTRDAAIRLLREKDRDIDLSGRAPRGREYEKTAEYLSALTIWLKQRV